VVCVVCECGFKTVFKKALGWGEADAGGGIIRGVLWARIKGGGQALRCLV
jgi:hypothetical protein